MRSPGLLGFLAGIFASAGTSLLTSIPAGSERGISALMLAVCAVPWLLSAAALMIASTKVEKIRRVVDLKVTPRLTPEEVREVFDEEWLQSRRSVVLVEILAILLAVAGALSLIKLYS